MGATEAGSRPVRRLSADFREIVVIALGILSAFAIDAWWGEREENRDVSRALAAVKRETEANLHELESAAAGYRRVAEAGMALLHLTGPRTGTDLADSTYVLLGDFWIPVSPHLTVGALETLIASGNLARIDEHVLEQALVEWHSRLATDVAQAAKLEYFLESEVRPRLWEYLPQLQIELESGFRYSEDLRERFLAGVPDGSRFTADVEGLLGDMEFESAVVQRTTMSLIMSRVAEGRLEDGRRLLELLDAQGV